MLFGAPPFCSQTKERTAMKILRWKSTLAFPSAPPVSADAIDLMQHLLIGREERLGFEGIKYHRFFTGIDWDNLQAMQSPYVPVVLDEEDTSNFEAFEPRHSVPEDEEGPMDPLTDMAFLGFSYNKKAELAPHEVDALTVPPKDKKDKKDKK
jgi:hypothetical protein